MTRPQPSHFGIAAEGASRRSRWNVACNRPTETLRNAVEGIMRRFGFVSVGILLANGCSSDAAAYPSVTPGRTAGPRVRFGVDLGAGLGFGVPEPPHFGAGIAAGGHVRVGVQATDLLAVWYQGSGLAAGGGSLSTWSPRTSGASGYFLQMNALVGEVTLRDMIQLALGPAAGVGLYAEIVGAVGLTNRFALTFGGRGAGTRRGFSIGAQLDLAYLPLPAALTGNLMVTLGWDTF